MSTTTITYGSRFSEQETAEGILGYINGGGYTDAQAAALLTALADAMRDEVNQRLPASATWQPPTSEFIIAVEEVASLPDQDAMATLFESAWRAVEARFAEIEAAVEGNPS